MLSFVMSAIVKDTRSLLIFIAVIVLLVQYVLTLIAFKKVIHFDSSVKKLVVWNFVIIFLLIIGPIIAIIYGSKHKPAPESTNVQDGTKEAVEEPGKVGVTTDVVDEDKANEADKPV